MSLDIRTPLTDLLSGTGEPGAPEREPHLPPSGPGRRSPRRGRRGRRRRGPLAKVLLLLLTCLVLLAAVPIGSALYVAWRLDHNIHRIDGVFDGLKNRPGKPTTGVAAKAVNILLLGTDRRSDVPTTGSDAKAPAWVAGAQRSDTMMIVHIAGDRRSAWVMSIPRDSWVPIPGHGYGKINAALSYGGPTLAVETVEQLTDVRIDHLAVVDWDGFKALTDAAGGVDVTVPNTVYDSARHLTWTAGVHHLDGAQALTYVGQRHGLPRGDLDRVARQQAFLRSLLQTSLHQEMRRDPQLLFGFLKTVTQHLSVDSDWSIRSMTSLVASLRNLRSSDIVYLTVPVASFGREGAQSVVNLAPTADGQLWRAVRRDQMYVWSVAHPNDLTPYVVN